MQIMAQAPHCDRPQDCRCCVCSAMLSGTEVPPLVGGVECSWCCGWCCGFIEHDNKMVERGMSNLAVWLQGPSALTWSQVHIPSDINPLLETATDCLRFITEFFEVINQSVPHIYHSALSHAPQSSIVQRLYGQQACSPVERVVTGVPASWESCTASVQMLDNHEHRCAIWLPCGQSVAVSIEEGIEIHDSNTLERKSCFKTPGHLLGHLPDLLVSSPDGHLLVCPYYT